jgi:hypothetical protein
MHIGSPARTNIGGPGSGGGAGSAQTPIPTHISTA